MSFKQPSLRQEQTGAICLADSLPDVLQDAEGRQVFCSDGVCKCFDRSAPASHARGE